MYYSYMRYRNCYSHSVTCILSVPTSCVLLSCADNLSHPLFVFYANHRSKFLKAQLYNYLLINLILMIHYLSDEAL